MQSYMRSGGGVLTSPSGYAPSSALVPLRVPGLSDQDQDTLTGLFMQLAAKTPRNELRRKYYDHKATLRDLGISVPPQLKNIETVMGWPGKSVEVLARRVVLEEFTLPDGSPADLGVDAVWTDNRMQTASRQGEKSALIYSTAFISTTAGDVAAGEPPVLMMVRSALYATGIWDPRPPGGLKAVLSVVSVDRDGRPDHFMMYVPNRVVICRKTGPGADAWDLRQVRHDLGVPVEPLVFRPELDRPFGHSRITRAVMSITDRAVRTAVRSEVSAEFFSAQQRYILGADDEAFTDKDGNPVPAWSALIGRMLLLGRDEDGNVPEVGTFPQQSMEPHLAQMRQLASEFAAETDLMPDTLGVIQDNPSSAEAIDARKEELSLTAEDCGNTFGGAWVRSMQRALRMLDDSPAARAEYARLRARYRNPKTPSLGSAADYTTKLVAAGVFPPTSEVTYDGLNLTESQREILRADVRRQRASELVSGLTAARQQPAAPVGVAV
jgi:Phage portal protein, SPP1 Gp6-like